jgi:hypothetical protein
MVRSPSARVAARNVPGRLKLKVALSQNFKCADCKKTLDEHFETDHIVPVARGGTACEGNLQALCPGCHRKKTAVDNTMTRKFDLHQMFGRNVMQLFPHDDGDDKWYPGTIVGVHDNTLDIVFIDGDRVLVPIETTQNRAKFRWVE